MQSKFTVTNVSTGAAMIASPLTQRSERVIVTTVKLLLDDSASPLMGGEVTLQFRGEMPQDFAFDQSLNVSIVPGNVIQFPAGAQAATNGN